MTEEEDAVEVEAEVEAEIAIDAIEDAPLAVVLHPIPEEERIEIATEEEDLAPQKAPSLDLAQTTEIKTEARKIRKEAKKKKRKSLKALKRVKRTENVLRMMILNPSQNQSQSPDLDQDLDQSLHQNLGRNRAQDQEVKIMGTENSGNDKSLIILVKAILYIILIIIIGSKF